jgi:hypothetical protein
MSIKCDLSDAEKTRHSRWEHLSDVEKYRRSRWERMDGLEQSITEAIEQAIKAKGEEEQAIADLPFNRAEVRSVLALAVARIVGNPKDPDDAWWSAHPDVTDDSLLLQYDEAEIEKFIDDVWIAIDPNRSIELYE